MKKKKKKKKDFVKSYLRHKYQNCLKFYQKKDGVSLGSSFGPVLANITMTELEDVIVKPLIAIGTIKFYNCFVDDTLLVMKPENINEVHNVLNKFGKNLGSTVNMSQNEVPHFLDLELSRGITFFWKDTNTGAYVNFTSFVPWTYCTSWTRSLVTRACDICTTDRFLSEINNIKRFA